MDQHQNFPPIICLMGQTATGKTNLALEITSTLPCTIISVDSGMIYRGMDIGTAKPVPAILAKTPHHLIDIRDPSESYSAGQFQKDASKLIAEIIAQNKIPLLVGGTMLYFRLLQHGIATLPSANQDFRDAIAKEAEEIGVSALHTRLAGIDPITALRIAPNDLQRIQRALEIYHLTGKTPTSVYAANQNQPFAYQSININLAVENKLFLNAQIEKRFAKMLADGFLEEVKKLYARKDLHPNLSALRAVGYRQTWRYLAGEIDHNTMCEEIIIATRHLAKHQRTWLKTWPNLNNFSAYAADTPQKVTTFLKAKYHL